MANGRYSAARRARGKRRRRDAAARLAASLLSYDSFAGYSFNHSEYGKMLKIFALKGSNSGKSTENDLFSSSKMHF